MIDFVIQFKNLPALNIELNSTSVAERYYQLVKLNYSREFPLFRDQLKYTLDYLKELAHLAQTNLGWDWIRDRYTIAETTQMHKDLEQYLAQGFDHIPAEHDHLIHELHYCLHSVESQASRGNFLQIEWFNNDRSPLSADEYPGKLHLEFGDIRLQNPYVGHPPLFIYQQQDHTNIMQTCRFHDQIAPGINITIEPDPKTIFSQTNYINWFIKHCPGFVEQHGAEVILKYTGHPVVGHITNLEALHQVKSARLLELESITFNK